MKPWEIIKQLESTNSRLDKERILQSVLLTMPEDKSFWEGCRLALDSLITFGVKQVPIKEEETAEAFNFEAYDEAFGIALTGFVNRSFTGNLARNTIERMMNSCDVDAWNYWYRRILIKDLRCGVTETTINKVRPNTVPVFSCQLAKDAADHEKKLTGKKILDYKLDGVRVLAVIQRIDSGTLTAMLMPKVTLHSRNGKVFENFKHIEEQIAWAAKDLEADWVLDGEITSDTFQSLMTQVHRKKDANAADAVFNMFDAIPLKDFLKGKYNVKQSNRSKDLKSLYGNFAEYEHIRLLDYVEVDLDTEEGRNKLDEMRDEAARLGLEGVMVKDANAPYECKRTDAWLKIKPNITVDLTVVNIEPGTGRNEGRLGAFVCEGEDNGRYICVNVGSGFSDRQRDVYWGNDNRIVGQTVEVKADAVTQNQDGTYSLRFPRFIRFRGFEPGEKL
jgi:DNA ligase-1